ncbi:class I SAM-dependent methyltransferase [Thalassolituus sp.]|jgi:16S rRNA (guanine1207-N2)-methyltransferase|uniref:class I SAM-dependent methyltransferase n=1 Tax=Thalassolituus sp. TaxID=2030822 RepID=UPI000C0F7F65|nr:class I SAM-dependent methyltransferase [Thalassolituus sp.]MBN57770.1 hypothetical protein [Oceanospirillaceae bacterium]MDQ4427579.1 class I SAM-dependent methyltransferase [Thalassolituus sp.]|tara:strand:+ start:747 stop:1754 length:1008 start_codon:yes stop_codon:yes gene_type:complete
MSNVYELLQRHPMLLTANTTIIGSEAHLPAGWAEHAAEHKVQVITADWLTAQAYQADKETPLVQFGVPDVAGLAGRLVIVLWPKAKAAGQALVSMLSQQVDNCYVVAANDAGGKSIGNALKDFASESTKMDSARHCSLWNIRLNKSEGTANWLRFASSFQAGELSFMTLPGVFGHGKLDKGTALLLEHVPAPAHGKLLDLGCGSGVIGLTMKSRSPALDITLTDVDAMALRSAELNSARLGLSAETIASDGLARVDGRFDYIFSNPPFHQGKRTDYEFALRLFRDAKRHMTRDGQLWIVANRHLAYEEWASEAFRSAEVMVQSNGFKLICASDPK